MPKLSLVMCLNMSRRAHLGKVVKKYQNILNKICIVQQQMGNKLCCQHNHQIHAVTFLANSIPNDDKYKQIQSRSVRFSEVSCRKSQKNVYIFSMSIVNEVDIHAEIPVLSELSDCFRSQNYELKFGSRALFDIFNKQYSNTLLEAKNEKTSIEYSVKIIPFKSYTSMEFKKAFYELWLNQKLGTKSNNVIKLLDYFIYGMIPEMQAFVLLFQRCTTSLANIAQYRKASGLNWKEKQKIKVYHEILESYQTLYNKNIVHRDLRPSNVFYSQNSGKFCIGNLSSGRLIRRMQQDDLMSVCGVPAFSCSEVKALASKEESIGYYEGIKQDYSGLLSILNIIETCDILDQNPLPKLQEKCLRDLRQHLVYNRNFQILAKEIQDLIQDKSIDIDTDIGDKAIANSCSYLLAHTYKDAIDKYVFDTYGLLGYNKQFSNKAHQMLQINTETDNQLENAPILKRLGQFYEQKGANGLQYFYNSFTLFLIRAEKQLKYDYPEKADEELDEAKEVYLKFSQSVNSQMPRIQLNRISALIQLYKSKKNFEEAASIIDKAFVQAARQNLPIEKQCKMLLAYGEIYKVNEQKRDEALKKLVTGLAICENSAAFQSPTSCRIFKSNFLYLIGLLHMDRMLFEHDPKKHRTQQKYGAQLKSKIETHFKSSLQIRQRQIVDDIDIAECLIQLGYFYYHDESFYDAKKYFQRALIRLNQLIDKVNPLKRLNVCYMKGSSSFYLDEFQAAHDDYVKCIHILESVPESTQKQLIFYNIEGNVGLAKMHLGLRTGKQLVESAMQKIKQIKGQYCYDYACLMMNYQRALIETR